MDYVTLGRTGLKVSVAGLGTGGHSRLGLRTGKSAEHAVGVVKAALDLGINFIDTAAVYQTESVVAAAIKGRRDGVVISTKIKHTLQAIRHPTGGMIDAAEARRRVEACLMQLETDRIDILHLHGVFRHEYDHCRDVILPALVKLREEGKIRFIGITERFDTDMTHEMLEHALPQDCWDVAMPGLNMVNQTATRRVLPAARRHGVGILCMYAIRDALARPDRLRAMVGRLLARGEIDRGEVDADDPLGFVVREGAAQSVTEAAYRYCRHTAGVDVVLTGTGSIAHLEENVRAINAGPLPAAVTDRLHKVFGRVTSESCDPPE